MMNAWAFGTVVLIVTIITIGVLLDRMGDRWHEYRCEERFYQPQLPQRGLPRGGPVIDVRSRPR
jgi:hypothetical protein